MYTFIYDRELRWVYVQRNGLTVTIISTGMDTVSDDELKKACNSWMREHSITEEYTIVNR